MATSTKAAETAAAIAQAIEELASQGQNYNVEARFAEIADYAEALGNFITGTDDYRNGEWLNRWGGITLNS